MHCALEGVVKFLLEPWFTSKGGDQPSNISQWVEEVDNHIREIKPPNSISRCPQSIEGHRKYWKANKLTAFLFFYGAMVLRGILSNVYYEHFMLFSKAIYMYMYTLSDKCDTIGPLQDPVTWYKITYTGEQVAQWDFQNKGMYIVLEVPLCNLLTSICNFVPCDRVLQRAYPK